MTGEKFCSGCRRYKPDAQIYSKKVTVLRRGKAINAAVSGFSPLDRVVMPRL